MIQYKNNLKDRCFKFSLEIISLCEKLPINIASKIIANQLIRSSTSIGANLIEAQASSSRLEFKKFHEIALKSANESKYWLQLIKELNSVNKIKIDELINEVTEISNMLGAGVLKLKQRKF